MVRNIVLVLAVAVAVNLASALPAGLYGDDQDLSGEGAGGVGSAAAASAAAVGSGAAAGSAAASSVGESGAAASSAAATGKGVVEAIGSAVKPDLKSLKLLEAKLDKLDIFNLRGQNILKDKLKGLLTIQKITAKLQELETPFKSLQAAIKQLLSIKENITEKHLKIISKIIEKLNSLINENLKWISNLTNTINNKLASQKGIKNILNKSS